jgi:hypothetical protein
VWERNAAGRHLPAFIAGANGMASPWGICVPARYFVVILAFLTCCDVGAAAERSGLPPLIERERFFADPDIAAAQLSPDGRFMSFLRPHEGTRNLWVKAVAEPFDEARPITAERGTPIDRYTWSVDGKYVLFAKDTNGDGNFNLFAVSPAAQAVKEAARLKAVRRD